MSEVIFNFHDVILLMTAMQCTFFAILLVATNSVSLKSTYFLAAFLLAHAFISMHELILWGALFKVKVREFFPGIYFVPGAAYYFDAPLLYFCIKSLVFKDFRFRRADILHLLPFVAFAIFMLVNFYSFESGQRQEMIESENFVYSAAYVIVEFLCKGLRVGYGVFCLLLVLQYKRQLESTQSNIIQVDATWLQVLVVGFLCVMGIEVVLGFTKIISLKAHFELSLFSYIGLTGNYSLFMLVNLLVFTGMRYFEKLTPVRQQDQDIAKKPIKDQLWNPGAAEEIDELIAKEKYYLSPDVTLESLAKSLSISTRDLSMLINRHFGVNFYEFINRYRIDEAKRMLISPEHKGCTITDIYLAVGFNSKSVFNTFFKKLVNMTPSQYRNSGGVEQSV